LLDWPAGTFYQVFLATHAFARVANPLYYWFFRAFLAEIGILRLSVPNLTRRTQALARLGRP
jgi:hypothetical protein